MRHFTLLDLKIFEAEFNSFGHDLAQEFLRSGDFFFLRFKNSDYCLKFYSSFPGYRLVHVPTTQLSGEVILKDLFPAKILKAKILNNDRVFGIWVRNKDREFALIFELIGSLTNLFVLNEDGKVLYTGRRVKDKRSLRPGVIYSLPEKKQFGLALNGFEDIEPQKFRSGFVCKLENHLTFEVKKPSVDSNCVEYYPYTYALDIYYTDFYARKVETVFSASQLNEIISFLESNFPLDRVLDEDFITVGDLRFPVTRGLKVSKLIGKLRACLVSMTRNVEKDKSQFSKTKGILEFISPSGKRVLVGRSANVNQKITFNLAKRDDLVFHVSGYKGAHVLLINDGKPFSDDDIMYCAALALKFSDAGSGKWEVIYAPVKYVHRTRSMPVGSILFKRYNTIIVEK